MTPGMIMRQIRTSVRNQESINEEVTESQTLNNDALIPEDYFKEINKINEELGRLTGKITPNIPVAFTEPRLVSRYKLLGKFITPIRKFGARLFTKWYVDSTINQQKHLNSELWLGLHRSVGIISEQNKLMKYLAANLNKEEISSLNHQISELKAETINLKEQNHLLKNKLLGLEKKYSTNMFKYFDFSTQFSASGEEVKKIFSQYLKYINPEDTLVDIGCGQGFFLELLKVNSIKGIGVDTDPKLVAVCSEKGLEAYVDEGKTYLEKQSEESIDAVFLAHVIEHLTLSEKIEFLKLCYEKLKKDGVLIIETPNTTSVYVMHNLYYLDPTHEKPLFPEALKHLAERAGFTVVASYLSGIINESETPKQYYNYSLVLKK